MTEKLRTCTYIHMHAWAIKKERTAWFPLFIDGEGLKPQETATENQSIQSTEGCLAGNEMHHK